MRAAALCSPADISSITAETFLSLCGPMDSFSLERSVEDLEASNDLEDSIEIGREYKTVDHTLAASRVTADYYTKHCLRQLVDA